MLMVVVLVQQRHLLQALQFLEEMVVLVVARIMLPPLQD